MEFVRGGGYFERSGENDSLFDLQGTGWLGGGVEGLEGRFLFHCCLCFFILLSSAVLLRPKRIYAEIQFPEREANMKLAPLVSDILWSSSWPQHLGNLTSLK